jgi:hypothetical protein
VLSWRPRPRKGKVVPVFDQLLRHEGTLGNGGVTLSFLTSALEGGEWLASRSSCFTRV